MSERTRTVLAIAALTVLGVVLYARRLEDVPPYIMHDEAQFALQAQSMAATGRDLGGHVLPVYFVEPEFLAGRDPAIVYATAAVLKLAPFSEGSARLATTLVGVLDVVLMLLVVRALLGSTPIGLAAAAMLALTPIHFMRARLILSPIYAIPFILLWLWTLIEHERQPSHRRLMMAGAWLGLGMYAYLACVIMMPLYLAASAALVLRRSGFSGVAALAGGFTVMLAPMLIWHATHPDRLAQIIGSYREFSTVPTASSMAGLKARAALYWSFFDPAFLFISGDSSIVNSTRQAGIFPAAFVVLLPVGLYWIVKSSRPIFWIIGAGFVLSPLAAVISGAIEMNRLMFAIPFSVLVACIGATMMLGGRRAERAAAILLLASIPLQFARFHADYDGPYRARSAPWMGGNLRGAMAPVIDASSAGTAIFIDARIPFAGRYWRFNALRQGRSDMIDVPKYYREPPVDAPKGAVLICRSADAECRALSASAEWRLGFSALEPDQSPSFDVFYRQAAP